MASKVVPRTTRLVPVNAVGGIFSLFFFILKMEKKIQRGEKKTKHFAHVHEEAFFLAECMWT